MKKNSRKKNSRQKTLVTLIQILGTCFFSFLCDDVWLKSGHGASLRFIDRGMHEPRQISANTAKLQPSSSNTHNNQNQCQNSVSQK
jgi:hypothetical protein